MLYLFLITALHGWIVPVSDEAWAFIRPLVYLNVWAWIVAILGYARTALDRPGRALAYLNEAVYPIYILHRTIIVVAGYYLVGLDLGPVVEPLLILIMTFGGCWLLYEWPIRRLRILRPVFGLTWAPRQSRCAVGPTPAAA